MYEANEDNNNKMWPQQQHQHQQFMGPVAPPQRPAPRQQLETSSSSSLHHRHHHHHHHHHHQQRELEASPPANHRLDNHLPPQQITHQRHGVVELPAPSNPRASRNMAEKQRRDNLNTNISTMASLVPTVAGSSRRMDKISILRLSAAYLRAYYTLGSGSVKFLPQQFNDLDLEQYIIENVVANAGFFLVVTTSGKIVYISRQVEDQLGHAQHELLGQSLYTFVCPEDYAELRSGLTPDETQTSTSNAIQANDETSNSSEESQSPKTERQFTEQRRSFSIRMSQKALNKRDHGQYECLQISGLLRLADACGNQSNNNNNNRSRPREINGTSNDIIFVGIARLVKRRTITELSLLEATKDEYVTRHLIDGRIIFCDHRISVVAGYMAEEVSGLSAFKFMHKEDVRWTMIGLRQMYDRGEGFGSSCYRLLSRTGQFIYLRTHGYLEYDKATQSVESFVCVNTLVTEKEGIELVREMKNRFSATVSGPAKVAIPLPSSITPPVQDSQWTDPKLTVEDPAQLEDAVKQLISNLPSPASGISASPSPITHNQFYKAAVYSTKLPPASIQAHKMGMKSLQLNSPSDEESSHVLTDGHETREYSSAQTDSASIDEPQCDRDIDDTRTSFLYTQTNTTVEESLGECETEDIVLGLGDDRFAEEKPNLEKNIHMTDANRNLSLQNCGAAGSRTSDNVREKRVSRRRATHGAVGKVQMDKCNKTIRTKSTGTASHRTHEAVRDANSSSNNRCIRPDSARKYSGSNFDEKILTDETQYTRKRSRSIEEVPVSVSKRKTNKMGSASSSNDFVLSNEDINYYPTVGSPLIPRLDDNELGELSGEANLISDIVLESDAGLSRELATASCLPSIDGYQQSNTGFSCSSVTGYQINEFHDDYSGDVLSPSLDVDTDLMKTNFEDLQSVVCNEKTIDEAHINEFTACNQAVNEEIRKTQFQLEQSIALRESQLSVLKRDLDNPALLAQRKNLKQIEAEHNETKQMLITLQQDHYNLQVNVQQNIGV